MTLSPGTRLGPYEVLSPLGAGISVKILQFMRDFQGSI